MSTVILANGTYPAGKQALEELNKAERVICCDGAGTAFARHGGHPFLVIGDLDSVEDGDLHCPLLKVSEQDTNDLSKAFRYCIGQGWTDLVILGATGKREDHTLGNISLLADFSQAAPDIKMVTDDGVFYVAQGGECRYDCRPGQEVSLFSLDGETAIWSKGLQYPLAGLIPAKWWQATLNVALENQFSITCSPGKKVLVYIANY